MLNWHVIELRCFQPLDHMDTISVSLKSLETDLALFGFGRELNFTLQKNLGQPSEWFMNRSVMHKISFSSVHLSKAVLMCVLCRTWLVWSLGLPCRRHISAGTSCWQASGDRIGQMCWCSPFNSCIVKFILCLLPWVLMLASLCTGQGKS